MNAKTVAALERINRAFYEERAAEFSDTRRAPWEGWARVAERLAEHGGGGDEGLSILDAGCGNGRFGSWLEGRLSTSFDYLGVDSSPALLEIALRDPGEAEGRRFLRLDLLSESLDPRIAARRFDLVAAFGLFHHVAAHARRRALVLRLARLVAPPGLLAVSFWQFAGRERFRRRIIPWRDYNRGAAEPIDTGELEPGDHLLAWGDPGTEAGPAAVRYCHHADAREARELMRQPGLVLVDAYRADGRDGDQNLYLVARRRP